MYNVIDIIQFTETLLTRFPEYRLRGIGLMTILDPQQIDTDPKFHERNILVRKPDGVVAEFVAFSSEIHHSVVGIFFKDLINEDIPRGSIISWE